MAESPSNCDVPNDGDTWYQLDAEDRIVAFGGPWSLPGFGHYVDGLVGRTILGTRIYDHVSGHFTQRFLKEFLDRARETGSAIRRSYRCDSPEFKRLMEMQAEKYGERGLWIIHRTLDERPLPYPLEFVTAKNRQLVNILRCSVCNKLQQRRISSVIWEEPESCAALTGSTRVIYTVCSDCRSGFSAKQSWGAISRST